MVDITDKKNSLREATAQAIIRVNSLKTINARKIKFQGECFEISRAAGLLGIKKTSELLQIVIQYLLNSQFEFKIKNLEIQILCTIKLFTRLVLRLKQCMEQV